MQATADQLGVTLVARICLDPDRVVVFDSDGHSGAAAPAGRSHDVGVTVREQQEVASLQPEGLPASALRERLSAEAFATAARSSVFDFSLGELVDDGLDCLAMAPSGV